MPSISRNISKNLQPLCDVYITARQPASKNDVINISTITKNTFIALIDTGANHSCITDRLVKRLDLSPILMANSVINTTGVQKVNTYEVCLYIPVVGQQKVNETNMQETIDVKGFMNIKAIETKYHKSSIFDVIIGMDIICKGHLTIVGSVFHFSI